MIRLALATAFLAVFGLVAWVAVAIIKDHFDAKKEAELFKPKYKTKKS